MILKGSEFFLRTLYTLFITQDMNDLFLILHSNKKKKVVSSSFLITITSVHSFRIKIYKSFLLNIVCICKHIMFKIKRAGQSLSLSLSSYGAP